MSQALFEQPREESNAVLDPPVKNSAIAPHLPKTGGIARRKKTLLIGGEAAVLVLSLVFGVRYLIWSAHHETTDDAYLAGHCTQSAPASSTPCSKC